MSSLHLDVGVPDTNEICDQLNQSRTTFLSVVLRMVLNASIFHLAKSPGNSSPNIDLAEMILMELEAISP